MSNLETMVVSADEDNVHTAFYGGKSNASTTRRFPAWDNIATTSDLLVNPRGIKVQKQYSDGNATAGVGLEQDFHRLLQNICLQTIHSFHRSGLVVRLNITIDGYCLSDLRRGVLLAAEEMVANAMKHGFHERSIGKIGVRVTSDEMSGTRLDISDDGWGIDFPKMREAAGFQLLRSLGNVALRDQPGIAGSRLTTVSLIVASYNAAALALRSATDGVSGVSQGPPFVRLLREQCEKIVTAHLAQELRVQLDLQVEGICPPSYQRMVVRVVDELVTNAMQHGFKNRAAGRVFVHIATRRTSGIHIAVCDDGCGFDSALVRSGNGFYLLRQIGYMTFQTWDGPFKPAAVISVRIPALPTTIASSTRQGCMSAAAERQSS